MTAPLGRVMSNGLQSSLSLSPALSCYITSTILSGINGGLVGGATGGIVGGFQGYINQGWNGVLEGMYNGASRGFGQGLGNGMLMGLINPFICFTAGTSVHSAVEKCAIESLRVGQRVLTEGTKGVEHQRGDGPTEIDPATWRLVRLQTAKPAGSDNLVDVELLRPLAWIEQTRAVVGSQIRFELAELGISGPACVLAIEPCPEIEPGRGRVITGTFTTARCSVLELRLSNGEVLEPTPPHRFYSETRQDWVAAGELRVGECLRTASGQALTVESVGLKAGEHRVYNLEVEQEHQFYVGKSGVLVHNAYEDGVTGTGKLTGKGNDTSRATVLADAGVSELHESLPNYGGMRGKATSGTLVTDIGDAYMRSGPGPGQGFSELEQFVIQKHVEVHAAALMQENGISEATLYINHPTGPCAGGYGCYDFLPDLLPDGAALHVVSPAGRITFYGGTI